MEKIKKKIFLYILILLFIPIFISIVLSLTNKSKYSESVDFDNTYEYNEKDINTVDVNVKKTYTSLYITAIGFVFIGSSVFIFLTKKKEW